MKEIDKKIKTYYESKSLSKDQLDRIVGKKNVNQNKQWKSILKMAAVFCVCIFCFFLYQNNFSKHNLLMKKYAKEVAFNHQKSLKSDILSGNAIELNKKMHKLNFEIHMPTELEDKYKLLGGRYCSIDERMAAQLRLKEKTSNEVSTLYVLDKLKNENLKESFYIDSIHIKIWNEKNNLFVLASNSLK